MLKKFFCPPCLIGLVLVLAVIGGYFLLKSGYRAPAPTTPTEEVATPEEEAVTPPIAKELTVLGSEYSFNPSSIIVQAGERVKITFRNDGRIGHNFIVKDLGISTRTIGSGQTDTVEFVAPTSGTYTFICSVSGHATAGMVGDLIVE